MKLTTWNCARGFDEKKTLIFRDNLDIAVIQECSRKSTETPVFEGYGATWVGVNASIGMGIFFREADWKIRLLKDQADDIQWVVPCEVTGPENFTLIAVWACQVKGNKRQSYVGQVNRALRENPHWFENGPVVVAGDFNSNARWDKERREWNHSIMVAELRSRGLTSIYHTARKEQHGEETTPTFHLQKNKEKNFHIDYVFVPDAWHHRLQMAVGDWSEWLPYSDHCPLTFSLSPQAPQQL